MSHDKSKHVHVKSVYKTQHSRSRQHVVYLSNAMRVGVVVKQ